MTVALVPIAEEEYDELREMLLDYYEELSDFDSEPEDPEDHLERSWQAMLDDMDGRELIWIVADGEHAGFAIVRNLADWAYEERMIASIAEFYVDPDFRRAGVGGEAVEVLLTEHRDRGTYLVEADIMRLNEPAKEFWYGLGFELQFLQTGRKP
jgi:GNAT superfamily N-acetyltransferase